MRHKEAGASRGPLGWGQAPQAVGVGQPRDLALELADEGPQAQAVASSTGLCEVEQGRPKRTFFERVSSQNQIHVCGHSSQKNTFLSRSLQCPSSDPPPQGPIEIPWLSVVYDWLWDVGVVWHSALAPSSSPNSWKPSETLNWSEQPDTYRGELK